MLFRFLILSVLLVTATASCQNTASKPHSETNAADTVSVATQEYNPTDKNILDLSILRKTLEDEVIYPLDQKLRLDRMEKPVPSDMPDLIFLGYYEGAFHFRQIDKEGNELEEYRPFHFHWDNYEPILVTTNKITFDIPDNNHIICAYIVDDKGHRIVHGGSLISKMIRAENGEITRSEDPPTLVYYNQPRGEYKADDPFVYMDVIMVNEGEKGVSGLMATIDAQTFEIPKSGTYQIKGLKPGDHMMELQLYRMGEKYFPPLSPSRMRFKVKE